MAGKLVDFSFDGELSLKEVETYRQRLESLPFLQAKLQQKQDSLPEFNVSFSLIGTAKPINKGSADKEFILLKVNINEDIKPGKIYYY